MKQDEASKQAQTGQMELTIKAWEAYANLETAFDNAIESAGRHYQDKEEWRLLRADIEGYFADVKNYLRTAILNPTNEERATL